MPPVLRPGFIKKQVILDTGIIIFFKRPCFILLKAFKRLIKSKLPGEIFFSISLMEYIRCIYEIFHFTVKNLSNSNNWIILST